MIGIKDRFIKNAVLVAVSGGLLSACTVLPEPLTSEQLVSQWVDDSKEMFKDAETLNTRLTFASAVARTFNYNLDKRAKSIEEALAFKQLDLVSYDQLPKLVADAGYIVRDRTLASSSRDLSTGTTGSPSFSLDRQSGTVDLGLTWNILDFGLSYYQAKTTADRALIALERRRKAEHALIAEVRSTYWRAAANQVLAGPIRSVLAEARRALQYSRTVETENLKSPAQALQYQKTLLETMRQMTAIEQHLSTAPYELAALINVSPSKPIRVSVPSRLSVPHWSLPPSRMVEIAYINNPDIHEQAYQARIAANDTRSEMLKALPGIGIVANIHYDSNSFLLNNFWTDIGPKLTWNLIKFASLPDIEETSALNEEAVKARRLAVRMAVLAQVYVADRQLKDSIKIFRQADDLWMVDTRLAAIYSSQAEANAAGELERISAQASAIASQLRRFEAYARVQKAYGRLQQTLGRDLVPVNREYENLAFLTQQIEHRLAVWDKGDHAPELQKTAAAVADRPRPLTIGKFTSTVVTNTSK